MWIIFSLFSNIPTFWPQYNVRIVLTTTRAFRRYPINWGPLDQRCSGSGHATTWARATLQLVISELQYVQQYIVLDKNIAYKQLILVFLLNYLEFQQPQHKKQLASQPPQPWPLPGRNGSLVPHLRPCAPRQCFEWMGNNPLSLQMYFLGGLRVCMALKVLLCSGNDASPQHRSIFEAHTHPQQPQKLYPLAWGVVAHPFNALAWSTRPHVGHQGAISISASGGHGLLWLCWSMLAIGG